MIHLLTLEEAALLMAKLSDSAYNNDNQEIFSQLGFNQYKFLEHNDAEGHLAASDTEVIITCRGTQPNQPSDLLADLNAFPKTNGTGWVHKGFRREARKLLPEVLAWAEKHKGKDIYVTGHSLGAAMALYLVQELEFAGHSHVELYIYASPRLGNEEYIAQIKSPHWRFVNCNDLVTHVPPQALGFEHYGELCYINFYGNIRPLSTYQRFKDRLRAHWHDLKNFRLFDGIQDHLMTGYITKLEKIRDSGQKINQR